MAQLKNNFIRFVFVLVCLSQVQGASKSLFDKSDNPFDELFKQVAKSAHNIAEKLNYKLSESEIQVDKHIESLKKTINYSDQHVQELIEKVEAIVEKFYAQFNEVVPKQFEKALDTLGKQDADLADKVKKIKAELIELKDALIKLFNELKKPVSEMFHELQGEVIGKAKPVVKRFTPIVKDIEEIILASIPDKKNKTK